MRLTRATLVLLLAVVATAPAASQGATGFSGRWRLAGPVNPAMNFAEELLITEVPSRSGLVIEQRFSSRVGLVRVAVNTSKSQPFSELASLVGGKLALKLPAATGLKRPSAGQYDEQWSVLPGRVLVVEVSSRPVAGSTADGRAMYEELVRSGKVPSTQNLVENGDAKRGIFAWLGFREARTDACDGNPCFVVRADGMLSQRILLPRDLKDQYLAIVGSGWTERLNADGVITGLPTLYATVSAEDGVRIVGHLQGMAGRPDFPNQWVKLAGVFPVPADAHFLNLQMHQASAKGTPHNGSAARFDNVAVHLFPSRAAAQTFVENWSGRQ